MIPFSKTNAGIKKQHVGRFLLCSITGVVINQMLFIKGLSMTLSIHAALLILVTPIFITLVAAWLGHEALTLIKIIGLCIGISGAVLLALDKDKTGNANSIIWGDIFIIINAISYAFYFVLVKPLMHEYGPVHVIRWVFTIGLLFVIPLGWNEFNAVEWSALEWKEWASLAFIVIGATFFAYLFNLVGVQHLGAGITGAYIYTQPVFATVIAIIFLGERLTLTKVIAAMLIMTGVFLVSQLRTRISRISRD